MADLNKIIEELSKLTVVEAADLSKQLEEKCYCSRTCSSTSSWSSSTSRRKSEFTIFLSSAGDKKINVIKEVELSLD